MTQSGSGGPLNHGLALRAGFGQRQGERWQLYSFLTATRMSRFVISSRCISPCSSAKASFRHGTTDD